MKIRSLGYYLFFFGLALVGTAVLQQQNFFKPSRSVPEEAKPEFQLMAEAWNTIQRYYVDRSALKPQSLGYGAIRGMTEALGDTGHTTFLTPEMIKQERSYMQGRYKGIGIEVRLQQGHIVIIAPIDGSPAQKAGLHPGDIILQVDGKDTAGVPISEVADWILGPEGTQVTLSVLERGSGKTRSMTLTRTSIVARNVRWQPLPGSLVAHLRIAAFSEGVSADLVSALKEIRDRDRTSIILDLRSDPGGLLEEAVNCASQFLKGGNVLLEKDAEGKVAPVPVRSGGVAPDIPMMVLINRGTASSSEVVSGALQDAKRATLLGETSFGTGTVLAQFPLSDGSALLLAVKEWLTPDGHTIWHKGIVPDITVPLPPDAYPVFPEQERNMSQAQLASCGDAQLLRALQLLQK